MKKILSVLLAALMILGISVTAFAASEKTVRSAANLQTRQEQPQNRSKRKVITKQEKTEEKASPLKKITEAFPFYKKQRNSVTAALTIRKMRC